MCSVIMIIFEIRTQNVFQVLLVQEDDMLGALSSDRADYAFDEWVLPSPKRTTFEVLTVHDIKYLKL